MYDGEWIAIFVFSKLMMKILSLPSPDPQDGCSRRLRHRTSHPDQDHYEIVQVTDKCYVYGHPKIKGRKRRRDM